MRSNRFLRPSVGLSHWPLLALLGLMTAVHAVSAAPAAKKSYVEVNIRALTFIPDPVTITVGQTIRWTNNDDRDCSLMAKDQSFKSGNLRPKETFEHTFNEPGEIDYIDMMHPRLRGTIVVKAKD